MLYNLKLILCPTPHFPVPNLPRYFQKEKNIAGTTQFNLLNGRLCKTRYFSFLPSLFALSVRVSNTFQICDIIMTKIHHGFYRKIKLLINGKLRTYNAYRKNISNRQLRKS